MYQPYIELSDMVTNTNHLNPLALCVQGNKLYTSVHTYEKTSVTLE